jgi:prepilin-type N-terminal cleavage/methylation domain-containing protein
MSMHAIPRQARGFSLVELMVALVAGLIVIGSVLAFTVSTVRAYNENIQSTRLTQDLRTSMNLVMRELRRAGFDADSVTRVLSASNPSAFTAMAVNGECVTYQYDRTDSSEVRGIRRNAATGALQMNASNSTVDCNGTTGWVDVSDPQTLEITKFTPALKTASFCTELASRPDPTDPSKTVYDIATGQVRNLSLCLKGRLRRDNTVERYVVDTARPRAENLTFQTNVAAASRCPAAPALADAMPDPATLNTNCASP